MDTFINILIIISLIIVVIGIIRLILEPPRNVGNFFIQLFLIDLLGDLFNGILENFSSNDDTFDD